MMGLGPVNEKKLIESGIKSSDDLISAGAKKAFLLVQEKADPGACLHLLYGLEAAIRGVPKKELPQEVKADLKEFFNEHSVK